VERVRARHFFLAGAAGLIRADARRPALCAFASRPNSTAEQGRGRRWACDASHGRRRRHANLSPIASRRWALPRGGNRSISSANGHRAYKPLCTFRDRRRRSRRPSAGGSQVHRRAKRRRHQTGARPRSMSRRATTTATNHLGGIRLSLAPAADGSITRAALRQAQAQLAAAQIAPSRTVSSAQPLRWAASA